MAMLVITRWCGNGFQLPCLPCENDDLNRKTSLGQKARGCGSMNIGRQDWETTELQGAL